MAEGVAITTVFSILVMVDLVGNSLVCLVITINRDMRTPINYLLLNLALADILFAVFNVPHIFNKLSHIRHPDGVIGTVLCKFVTDGQIASIGAVASFVTLAAIALERYYAVVYPLSDKGTLTELRLKVIITGSWIFSVLVNIPAFLVLKFDKESYSCTFDWPEEWMDTAFQMNWNVLTILTFLVMAVIYSRVVYTLWVKNNHDNHLTHQQRGVIRLRKRVTSMVVTLSVIFGICWGTDQVIYSFTPAGPALVAIANTMVMFNAAVNPFVYALLNQQFRAKMKKMMCCTGYFSRRVHPTTEMNITSLNLPASTTTRPTSLQDQA